MRPDGGHANYATYGYGLYCILLGQAEPFLTRNRLIIVCDGELINLAFDALVRRMPIAGAEPRFLIEDFTITYVPSILDIDVAMEKHSVQANTDSIAVFADPIFPSTGPYELPRLPYSRIEAKQIAALFPSSTVYLRTAASKDRVERGGSWSI